MADTSSLPPTGALQSAQHRLDGAAAWSNSHPFARRTNPEQDSAVNQFTTLKPKGFLSGDLFSLAHVPSANMEGLWAVLQPGATRFILFRWCLRYSHSQSSIFSNRVHFLKGDEWHICGIKQADALCEIPLRRHIKGCKLRRDLRHKRNILNTVIHYNSKVDQHDVPLVIRRIPSADPLFPLMSHLKWLKYIQITTHDAEMLQTISL